MRFALGAVFSTALDGAGTSAKLFVLFIDEMHPHQQCVRYARAIAATDVEKVNANAQGIIQLVPE